MTYKQKLMTRLIYNGMFLKVIKAVHIPMPKIERRRIAEPNRKKIRQARTHIPFIETIEQNILSGDVIPCITSYDRSS